MDNAQTPVSQLEALPADIFNKILDNLAPKSGGYVYRYTQEQGNELIATFVHLRLVCKKFNQIISLAKFCELFNHEELSYLFYNKLCLYKGINTEWLYLVAKCVGPNVLCPAPLLADLQSDTNKKFPGNKLPREYFLARIIQVATSEDAVLPAVQILLSAGVKAIFPGTKNDTALSQCVTEGTPLYNATSKDYKSVALLLLDHCAPIEHVDTKQQDNSPDQCPRCSRCTLL